MKGRFINLLSVAVFAILLWTSCAKEEPEANTTYGGNKTVIESVSDDKEEKVDGDAEFYIELARMFSYRIEIDKAIEHYNVAIKLAPQTAESYDFYHERGSLWISKGEYTKAISDLERAIHIDAQSTGIFALGVAWQKKGEFDKAIEYYNESISLRPDNAFQYINRGSAWEEKGNSDRAIADYNRSLELNPHYMAYINKGSALEKMGDFDKAMEN